MIIGREGESTIGLHFIANRSTYVARGWIRSMSINDGGPQEFSVLFNKKVVATTKNGVITKASFTPAAIASMRDKTSKDDKISTLAWSDELFNMTSMAVVHIETPEPPNRQNYYITQRWVQAFDNPKESDRDMDLVPLPCLKIFNLHSADRASIVGKSFPIRV